VLRNLPSHTQAAVRVAGGLHALVALLCVGPDTLAAEQGARALAVVCRGNAANCSTLLEVRTAHHLSAPLSVMPSPQLLVRLRLAGRSVSSGYTQPRAHASRSLRLDLLRSACSTILLLKPSGVDECVHGCSTAVWASPSSPWHLGTPPTVH
jgi:hypothetical protein